jgi:hypothetical protein
LKGGKTRSESMRRAHTRGQPEMRMAFCPPSASARLRSMDARIIEDQPRRIRPIH